MTSVFLHKQKQMNNGFLWAAMYKKQKTKGGEYSCFKNLDLVDFYQLNTKVSSEVIHSHSSLYRLIRTTELLYNILSNKI